MCVRARSCRSSHHCRLGGQVTGGMCSSIFWIHGSGGEFATNLLIHDEADDHFGSAIIEWDSISATLFLSSAMPAFDFTSTDCPGRPETTGQTWNSCPQTWKIRPVVIYSPNRGAIRVRDVAAGHQANELTVAYSSIILPHGSQIADYAPAGRQSPNGYTFLVRDGADVTITIDGAAADASWDDLFAMDYSQPTFPSEKKTSFTLTVAGAGAAADGLAGGPYTISSDHSRAFMTPFGAMTSAAGAWYDAMNTNGAAGTWRSGSNFLTPAAFEEQRVQFVRGYTNWRS